MVLTPLYTSGIRCPFRPGLVLRHRIHRFTVRYRSSLHFFTFALSSDFTFAYSFVIRFHFHLLCLFCLFCRFCLSCDACLSCEKSVTICHSLTHSLTHLLIQPRSKHVIHWDSLGGLCGEYGAPYAAGPQRSGRLTRALQLRVRLLGGPPEPTRLHRVW